MQERYDEFQNFVKSNNNLITFLQQMTGGICFPSFLSSYA